MKAIRQGLALGHELHRHGVHAVALAGRRRSVIEHVPEMAPAAGAADLGADHAVAGVPHEGDVGRGRSARRSSATRFRTRTSCRSGTAAGRTGGRRRCRRLASLNTPQNGASVPCSRRTSRSSSVRSAVRILYCSADGGLRSKPAIECWAASALVSGAGWFILLSRRLGLGGDRNLDGS